MNKGFTIPELLVALAVFSLVIGAATNLLVSGIAGQRSSLAMQELLDQVSFASEYMSRHLRGAQKDVGPVCLSAGGLNYELTQGGAGVKFLNVQGQCQEFLAQGGRILERLGAQEQFLTSDNLTVTFLQFVLQGESQEDNLQPRVTFAFEIEGQGKSLQSRPKLQFQSAVSQRNADVPVAAGDAPPPPPPSDDTIPPGAIANLSALSATTFSVNLFWTAPGDDGSTGTASRYDVRYSTTPLGGGTGWFGAAIKVEEEPVPQPAGSAESMTVSRLSAGTTYYFAIKTIDEAGNISSTSNAGSAATSLAADTTAPSAIADLSASEATDSSIKLTWTAPGDDGSTGTAATYEVMYSGGIGITSTNWRLISQATGVPAPQPAGTIQSMTVSGLSSSAAYHFRIRSADEAPNWSDLSNEASLTTNAPPAPPPPDITAPAAISDLAASNPTASSVDLSWTATGDDGNEGTASSYDIRYATSKITEETWVGAAQAANEPPPQPSGSSESFTVSGLSSSTTYHFAMKVLDEVQNESELSNVPNETTSAAPPSPAPEDCAQVASGTITYGVSTKNQPQIAAVTFDPLDVQEGSTQLVTVKAKDTNGNPITEVSGTITMDNGPHAISFSLTAGTDLDGTWTASWTSSSTYCHTYEVEITATSASGTSSVVLSIVG